MFHIWHRIHCLSNDFDLFSHLVIWYDTYSDSYHVNHNLIQDQQFFSLDPERIWIFLSLYASTDEKHCSCTNHHLLHPMRSKVSCPPTCEGKMTVCGEKSQAWSTGTGEVQWIWNENIEWHHWFGTSCNQLKHQKYSEDHLSLLEVIFLDPELEAQGGDVEGGTQVGGVGGGVHPLKTKVCQRLLVDHPTDVRSDRRLKERQIWKCLLESLNKQQAHIVCWAI